MGTHNHAEVLDESYKHSVPDGAETHFKVTVVSAVFDGMKLLDRHRRVNDALAPEFASGLHALAITAKAPSQWDASSVAAATPPCLGGMKDKK